MKTRFLCCLAVLVCLMLSTVPPTLPSAAAAETAPDLLLVVDASGSMWGQIDSQNTENKIVIARRVLREVLADLPPETRLGLLAYGHRREGDCGDIELLAPLGGTDAAGLAAAVDGLNPKGKTPITASVERAFEALDGAAGPATILLISDGLETCGGDPCAAVRAAAERGVDFRLHVVGFGIEDDDVSQLECAAQAGGGLYLAADDAGELSAALGRAVEQTDVASREATLSVAASRDGEPVDAVVAVVPVGSEATTTDAIAMGRTYTGPDTNPRLLPVPAGTWDVVVRARGLDGDPMVRLSAVEVPGGEVVERRADFSSGELAVGVTRNGALSDATVTVTRTGETRQVAGGRTYTAERSNPKVFRLTPGDYTVTAQVLEIEGEPSHAWERLTVEAGGRTEVSQDWASGVLRVRVLSGGEGVVAVVRVTRDGNPVAQARTGADGAREMVLEPGTYRVVVQPLRSDARPELEVTVEAGETSEERVELGGG